MADSTNSVYSTDLDLSNYEIITTIDTRKANSWKSKYPLLDNHFSDFNITNGENAFIFRLLGNEVVERLYFSLYDSDTGALAQAFMPLQPYPFNLAMCRGMAGAELYFYNDNMLIFKPATATEA